MIATHQLHENIAAALPALKQAAVWGLSSAAATHLTGDKKKKNLTPEEKKKIRKDSLKKLAVSGGLGGVAGALGTLV